MNESIKLEKVKKSCNTTAKIAKICKIIMIVLAAISMMGSIVCFVYQNQIDEGMEQITSGNVVDKNGGMIVWDVDELEFDGMFDISFSTDELLGNGEYGLLSALYCLVGMIVLVIAAVMFGIIQKIFDTIKKSETPFSDEVLNKLKVLFIVATVFMGITIRIGFGVFTGLICWCIYNIFEYGYVIQKQIDETL